MAVRTTSPAVVALLGENYDTTRNPALTPFIETASVQVNRVAARALATATTLSDADAELLERWLASHYYLVSDPVLKQKATKGASGTIEGQTGDGFASTRYGQTAMQLDPTGYLASVNSGVRRKASVTWLGVDDA